MSWTMSKAPARKSSSWWKGAHKLRVKLGWFEVEGEGLLAVVAALFLCLVLIGCMMVRWHWA